MENEKVIPIETLSKFIEWAAQFSDGQYLFRGVSTESYKIEASAAYYSRGLAYAEKGEVDSAIENYNESIQLNPDFADAYNYRGIAYRNKGEIDRAIEDHDQAIQIKSDNVLFYNDRSIALLQAQEWEKARSDLTIARNMGVDIIALFHNAYAGVTDFEQKHSVKLPEDIAALLTPPQA